MHGSSRIAPSRTARFVKKWTQSQSHCFENDIQIGVEVLSESKGSMSNTCMEGCTVGVYAESGATMDISNGSRSRSSNYALIYDVNAPQDLQL